MSGYRDGQGRYRKVGRKVAGFFLTCQRCGYLGAPHEDEVCERNEEYDRRRAASSTATTSEPEP